MSTRQKTGRNIGNVVHKKDTDLSCLEFINKYHDDEDHDISLCNKCDTYKREYVGLSINKKQKHIKNGLPHIYKCDRLVPSNPKWQRFSESSVFDNIQISAEIARSAGIKRSAAINVVGEGGGDGVGSDRCVVEDGGRGSFFFTGVAML